ncbi:MAG: tetratricopeptide repeat protein, partial [bacterium]
EAAAANNRGALARKRGSRSEARTLFVRAQALAEEADATAVEASVANNLALLDFEAGQWASATELLDRALALDRAGGDAAGEALRLYNLAAVAMATGNGTEAIEHLEEAHRIDRGREDVPAIARDLEALAAARVASGGNVRRAINERRRAIDIRRLLHDTTAAERGEAEIRVWCVALAAEPSPLDCVAMRAGAIGTAAAGDALE